MSEPTLIDGSRMYHELIKAGEEWADAKSAYHALDDSTKSVLADITRDHRGIKQGSKGVEPISRMEAEQEALRSAEYREHLTGVSAAHRAFLRAQVKYDSLRTLVELRRSEESTRRAEMRL